MPQITTRGLQSSASAQSAIPAIQWAAASGTSDVIAAAFSPKVTSITDGLALGVRLTATNTTTTPTFNADMNGPHVIVKNFDEALEPGDLPAEAIFRYNATNGVWVLENPATQWREITEWAIAAGSADAITAAYTPSHGSLKDGMLLGVRFGAANATTTPTLAVDTFNAYIIKKFGGQPLIAGDIFGAGHEGIVRYHNAGTPWFELLNPQFYNGYDPTFGVKFKVLTADAATFADDNSAHAIAGLGVTLPVGVFVFRGHIRTTRTAGTTSHTTSFLFGGTAVITNIVFVVRARTGDAAASAAVNSVAFEAAAGGVVKAASTSATEDVDLEIEGVVTIGTGGTLLPEMQYSVATGGVTTPKAGSWFDYVPRTNPQGTWA